MPLPGKFSSDADDQGLFFMIALIGTSLLWIRIVQARGKFMDLGNI